VLAVVPRRAPERVVSLMQRFRDWRDNAAWHHIWVGNGPFWWTCRDCRAIRRQR
jgi:hypothetical protein